MKMIWEVEKAHRRSVLIGTAHFFPYSFRRSLSGLIRDADTVLFEGPLDPESLAAVLEVGRGGADGPHLFQSLDPRTVKKICGVLNPARQERLSFLSLSYPGPREEAPAYGLIRGMKPWLAFFTIWSRYLEKKGWKHSVDMEGYQIAMEMGKRIIPLESIEEQIRVLENLPCERLLKFLERIDEWDGYAREYVRRYLDGDLEGIRSATGLFPSRTSSVIDRRDGILFSRMLHHLEKGATVVFVGAPHIPGICSLLEEQGYQVKRHVREI
ncbi:MAG: TraB/GumN family protein [Desulfatiglandales bacterium]